MRILILSKRDLTATVLLNDLMARLAPLEGCRLRVVLAERTRPVELTVPDLRRMKHFERDLPFGTLFPQIDDAPGRREGDALMTPVQLARHYDVDMAVARGLDDPVFNAALAQFQPELVVSARFSFLIPTRLFGAARHGVVNVHPGRLPDYAGLYPHFFSMLAGEETLGCSLHLVDDGIDSGPMIAQGCVPILPGRSAFAHNLDSHLLGNRLINETVEKLLAGAPIATVPQGSSKVKCNSYPTPAEFERFHSTGLSLIDVQEYRDILGRFGLSVDFPCDTNRF